MVRYVGRFGTVIGFLLAAQYLKTQTLAAPLPCGPAPSARSLADLRSWVDSNRRTLSVVSGGLLSLVPWMQVRSAGLAGQRGLRCWAGVVRGAGCGFKRPARRGALPCVGMPRQTCPGARHRPY